MIAVAKSELNEILGPLDCARAILNAVGRADIVNATDAKKMTALMYAVKMGHVEIVRILLSFKANPDLRNSRSRSVRE